MVRGGIGLGPVFAFEWRAEARRARTFWLRVGIAGLLLGALCVVQWTEPASGIYQSFDEASAVARRFFAALVVTLLALVMIVAPAASAGSLANERLRGTLTHLLVTDLSSAEIVLGKLGARMASILGLVACAVPVVYLASMLGGIEPETLAGSFAVILAVAVLGTSLALLLSVFGPKPHETLMLITFVWGAWLVAGPIKRAFGGTSWIDPIDPFRLVMAPLEEKSAGATNPAWFLGLSLSLSVICVLVTVLCLRPLLRGEGVRRRREGSVLAALFRGFRRCLSPTLDQNPVLWREWHRRRARGLGAVILFLYVAGSIVFPAWVIWRGTATSGGLSRSVVEIEAIFTSGFQVSFGLLFLTMAAATALAEERVRGSLDEVMATPLSTRSLVLGKWWGSCRWGILIAIPAAAITTAKALERNGNLGYVAAVVALVLAYSAGFSSMALLFATWIRGTGRAIAASLFVYLLITVGWFFLILFIANHEMGAGIVSLSPFYGVMYPLVYGIYRVDDSSGVVPFVCLWVWVYLTIAAVCLVLAVATFDRCVGRVPASPHGPDDPDRAREWRAGVDRAGASHAGTATLAAR